MLINYIVWLNTIKSSTRIPIFKLKSIIPLLDYDIIMNQYRQTLVIDY